MKVLVDVQNINGQNGDIYYKGYYMGSFGFGSDIEPHEDSQTKISDIVKLKEAGFTSEDIIEMKKASLI